MNIKELAKGFALGASGMCEKGQNGLMDAANVGDLVTEYWRGIDFCLARDYPRLRTMKRFRDEFKAQHIYIGESITLINERRAAFLDDCTVELTANEYAVSYLYLKHNSKLTIKASGYAFVTVDALDSSIVNIECSDGAKVIVNLYAKASVFHVGENIKIVHKNLETYAL